jgi:anti-sigma factor RsiW
MMSHEEIRDLIHPYTDGELDLVNAREVERHLSGCEECRRLERGIRSLRDALTKSSPAYRAPAHLRKKLKAALRREAGSAPELFSPWLVFLAGAASALLIFSFVFFQTTRAPHNAIADQVVANHMRSLLATHLVDVVSSDQHTVKPWFDGKVDFAPEVRDLSAEGFPLVGGRLDYLDGKIVAALVYHRNKHPINLFIEPVSTNRNAAPTTLARRGYNLIHWTRDEMDYWAVSDLNMTELRQFADRLAL